VSPGEGTPSQIRRRIVLSGVGGQGVLFLSRLLAEAAVSRGLPVIASETHGMAQRGGVVVSHLKVGSFDSPLVRAGGADLLLVLKEENVPLHLPFLREGGILVVNAPGGYRGSPGARAGSVDADAAALSAGYPQGANLVLLGFALARFGRETAGGLFCTVDELRDAVSKRYGAGSARRAAALAALDLGIARGT